MSYELLGQMRDGVDVVYDNQSSHAATHFADTPGLRELVQEVIGHTVSTGEPMWFETDMGREVGTTDLVETDEQDDIVYDKRIGREGYSRFTRSQQPAPCRLVTVALELFRDGQYELTSAWIGPVGVPFPDAPVATRESQVYWSCHALVWGSQEIQPGSERPDCPW
ncbi:MAG TPA: hypothetical protein VK983_04755 [Candidatus Limnocylindrales bacterium]|nr:hypothetical protein [Candidatus Limnocylindrales bacterium]